MPSENTKASLRRDFLARHVFPDAAARKTLEAILHPRIRTLWQCQLSEWREANSRIPIGSNTRVFCVVIPLLFETRAETEVDATLCVACLSATQHQRLSSRGWSPQQISQRIESQLPIEEKMARADYVIWNEASIEVLAEQLDQVLGSKPNN